MPTSEAIKRRLADAVQALAENKPNKAAGLLREAADEINAAEAKVLEENPPQTVPAGPVLNLAAVRAPDPYVQARDLQSCSRGVHVYGPIDSNGWARCTVCGTVNIAPPVA